MSTKTPTQFDNTVRILTPLSPGVFTSVYNEAIMDACVLARVDPDEVSSVGMVGKEVVAVTVTLRLPVCDDPRPEHLDTFTSIDDVLASKGAEERWEAIRRVLREIDKRDMAVQPFTEKGVK